MPHPKKRKTKSARNQQRSHHALKKIDLTECKKCGEPVKSHYACYNCGYYNNREAVEVVKKLSKAERRMSGKPKKEEGKKEKKI
jgi:large subunit ribosomal protein L32